MATGFKGF